MRNKSTLQVRPPSLSERSLLNDRALHSFLIGAEEDYILTRILLFSSIHDAGMYHYQQCMEKLLKAFLIQNNVLFRNTHNLETLRNLCAPLDAFFVDVDLADACDKVTPFEVVGRYPSNLLRSYGWIMPNLVFFLDEFVSEMRQKINRQGARDPIGEMQSSGRFSILDYSGMSKNLAEIFFTENSYFRKI